MALIVSLKMAADQHRSSLCDDIACNGNNWENVQWDGSANNFAFVSTSRDHKQEWLRVADAEAGNVREVISETAPEFFESGNGKVNWKYLPKSKEFLWFWALSDADKRAYLKHWLRPGDPQGRKIAGCRYLVIEAVSLPSTARTSEAQPKVAKAGAASGVVSEIPCFAHNPF